MAKSLITSDKLTGLIRLLKLVEHLNGVVVEVGVYQGGSALILAQNTPSLIYLFDTFSGMPHYNPEIDSQWKIGSFAEVSYDQILEEFKKYSNVSVYKGEFPKENSEVLNGQQIKFLHLDVDNYQSYKDCLEYFYHRMVVGGIMVFDDYNESCCPGANKAIDEFFEGKEKIVCADTIFVVKK